MGAFLLPTLLQILHCSTARRAHTGAPLSNHWFVFNHLAICFHKTYTNLRLSNSLFQSCSKSITYSTPFSLGNYAKTQLQYSDVNNTTMVFKKYEQNLISGSQTSISCAQPKATTRYREQKQFAKDQNDIWK